MRLPGAAFSHVSSTLPLLRALAAVTPPPPGEAGWGPPVNAATVPVARTVVSPLTVPEAWNRAVEIGPIALSPEMVGERSANLRALWDENALYLRVKVADATPWQPIAANQDWWNADSVHLRFCTDPGAGFLPARVLNLVLYNDGLAAHAMAFRGVDIKDPVWDMQPLTSRVDVEKGGYTVTLCLPWNWLDDEFKPRAKNSFRFAFLANDSDLLTTEAILGANFNNAHALYKPDAWGSMTLE